MKPDLRVQSCNFRERFCPLRGGIGGGMGGIGEKRKLLDARF